MNCDSILLEPEQANCDWAIRESTRHPGPSSVSESSVPDWLDRGQIPGLDGFRAIAVILVLMCHCVNTRGFPQWPLLRTIADHGKLGVDIFFVISGFLITTLLARELERRGRVNLKRFFVRRSLRIIPAYGALLAVVAICQYAGKLHLESRDWIAALTYTTNAIHNPSWDLGHTWSLAVEEHFYLLWPVALFAGGLAGGWRMALGCIASCWCVRCFIALILPRFVSAADALYYASMSENWTITRLDTISMGCLLALACRSDDWRRWLDRITRPRLLVLYFAMICASLAVGKDSTKFHLCVSYTLNAACVALLMWGMIRSEGVARRVFANPILTTIGVGSYSIYLWQQMFIHPLQIGWIHRFPQNIVLAFAAASLSYWIVERPLNRLKDRIAA